MVSTRSWLPLKLVSRSWPHTEENAQNYCDISTAVILLSPLNVKGTIDSKALLRIVQPICSSLSRLEAFLNRRITFPTKFSWQRRKHTRKGT